jgi:L-rhamnose mutarotase
MFLHPGQREEYKRRHDALWPELRALLKQAGVRNYSIYLDDKTNILFAYLERPLNHAMGELPDDAIMKRWWAFMKDIMQANPDGSPVSEPLDEVFHLD